MAVMVVGRLARRLLGWLGVRGRLPERLSGLDGLTTL
jgi:hypothetical protein